MNTISSGTNAGAMHIAGERAALFDSITVLTVDGVFVASPSGAEFDQAMQRLEAGTHPSAALPKGFTAIPFESIAKVVANRHDDSLNIHFRAKEGNRSKNISFADSAKRNATFDALAARLGGAFVRSTHELSRARAAVGPLIGLLVTALATWLMHGAALEIRSGTAGEVHGRKRLLKQIVAWLADLLGPTGVVIVGALFALGMVYWLYLRMKKPPILMILKRTS